MKVREHERHRVLKTAETIAQTDNGIISFSSFIVNISFRGLEFRSSTYLPPDTPVLVMLPIIDDEGMEDRAVLLGNVVWVEQGDSQYHTGIMFKKEITQECNTELIYSYFN